MADVANDVFKFCWIFPDFLSNFVFLFVLVFVPYEMPALTSEKVEEFLDGKLRLISDLTEQLKQALESNLPVKYWIWYHPSDLVAAWEGQNRPCGRKCEP